MNIDRLIAELEEARETLGGAAEIRIAYQPNYPIRATVQMVTIPESRDVGDLYTEDHRAPMQEKDGTFVWIAAGTVPDNENPYGPKWAWGEQQDWS